MLISVFLDLKNPLILIDNNLEDQKVNDLIIAYNAEYIFLHNKNLNKKIKKMYSTNNTIGTFTNYKIKKKF